MMYNRKNTRQIGNATESLVVEYLEKEGCRILNRNYHIPQAEIDIVASNNNVINFIEVKKIPANWDGVDISAKISKQKIHKIRLAASYYLAQHQEIKYDKVSFDIALVIEGKVSYFSEAF